METGKLGLRIAFYGVAAFILAFLGYSTLIFLLAGIALLVEKNEWATRQIIQAFGLCVISSLIYSAFDVLDFLYDIPFVGAAYGTIMGLINAIISIIVLIFCIMGIVRNMKGQEAKLPLFHKFANWAFGIVNVAANNYNQTTQQNMNNTYANNQSYNANPYANNSQNPSTPVDNNMQQ